jgi:3-phenylpropionate/cinnamic acid dioxygenase small subunit
MDIEATVQALVDRQQIIDTLYRYASTIDAKDYPRLRSLFVDDAVGQYAGAEPIHGADEIVAWIDSMTLDRAWQHHLVNVYHVDIDGDEAHTLTYHTSHQTTTTDPDTVIVIVARYRDVLRKVDGTWKIADKRMDVGWMEERHAPQAAMSDQEAVEALAARSADDS